ncbi:hypothetical protein VTN77DRAFT_1484 [Rasamsonia byssochlamydoides]|uniref:uncharacterized protein n=1 Tax=Rasamsonia byssochlamydoides TaxID=89139 RepID=UPI003743CE77
MDGPEWESNNLEQSLRKNNNNETMKPDQEPPQQPKIKPGADAIAIIGIAHRFPGKDMDDPNELWDLIRQGRDASSTTADETNININMDSYYHPDPEHVGTVNVNARNNGFFLVEDADAFDAPFFHLTRAEAAAMDSQQKLVLENVFHALENAGIQPSKIASSSTSVFVGSFANDHFIASNQDLEMKMKYKGIGTSHAMLANRVSWFFDLQDTSLAVDTACSSGLVALHLACQDLKAGESEMAIVSGVNVIGFPTSSLALSSLSFLSPDGRSYSYDHRANGYARAEGVGTVILKPVSAAIRDGDTIRAVIRSTGSNQDAKTPGITVPSRAAQEQLIRDVYSKEGIDLGQTVYIEGHGTGTRVGDPIEVEALVNAFAPASRNTPLYLGSIKSNMGHMEGAAGIAGVIKAVLVLESGVVPPLAEFHAPNPSIKPDEWNIRLPTEATPWPAAMAVRHASVNSFGFGGSNAHVVLDDAQSYLQPRGLKGLHACSGGILPNSQGHNGGLGLNRKSRLFVLSAFDNDGVHRNAAKLIDHLKKVTSNSNFNQNETEKRQYLDDLAYTISEKRAQLPWKSFCIADSIENLVTNLTSTTTDPVRISHESRPCLGFVFTGQGAQWAGMGQALMAFPVFRASIQDASAYLKSLGSSWVLIVRCTALQVALVELLASWNVFPDHVVGHSSGEIAAAFCAGAISRETAWKLAYLRGLVVSNHLHKPGAMLAVGTQPDILQHYLDEINNDGELQGVLAVACYNSPKNLTVSGDRDKIQALKALLERDQVFARQLPVNTAYHSEHMHSVSQLYAELIGEGCGEGQKLQLPHEVQMFSSLTSKSIQHEQLVNKGYLVDNLVNPVRFSDGLLAMCSQFAGKAAVLVEIGPHSTLRSAVKETLAQQSELRSTEYCCAVSRIDQSADPILNVAGVLYCRGHEVNLSAVNSLDRQRPSQMLTRLPPYAFNHSHMISWGPPCPIGTPRWRNVLRPSEIPWVDDHKISGNIVYPGVGYLVMAIEASKQIADPSRQIAGFRLKDVALKAMLVIPDTEDGVEVSVSVRRARESALDTSRYWHEFTVFSYNPSEDSWLEHCSGAIQLEYDVPTGPVDDGREAAAEKQVFARLFERATEVCRFPVDVNRGYEWIQRSGLAFGPTFRNASHVKIGRGLGEVIGTVTIPDIAAIMPKNFLYPHTIHPATVDSLIHLFFPAAMDADPGMGLGHAVVPTFFKEVWVSNLIDNVPQHSYQAHSRARKVALNKFDIDITAWDSKTNEAMLTIRGLQTSPVQAMSSEDDMVEPQLCHRIEWVPDLLLNTVTPSYLDDIDVDASAAEGESKPFEELQLASVGFIIGALEQLKGLDVMMLPEHHQKFYRWMEKQAAGLENERIRFQRPGWGGYLRHRTHRDELLGRIKGSNDGDLLIRMGSRIASILRQEVHPLEVMFHGDLMDGYYATFLSESGQIPARLEAYLKILGQNRTNLRIIEIGAGTGSMTSYILQALNPFDPDNNGELDRWSIASYTFTDISAGFFDKAKARFKGWESILTFGTLNIEDDPMSQGYEREAYDVVVASSVLHALKNTLRNVRSLLKPDGKLIFFESVQQHLLWEPLCFGLLPGWWLSSEPFRNWGPTATEEEWCRLLTETSFDGDDLVVLKDREDDDKHEHSLIIATAASPIVSNAVMNVVIVCRPAPRQDELIASLEAEIHSNNMTCQVVEYASLDDSIDLSNAICISLLGLGLGIDLSVADENTFDKVKHLLLSCQTVLWLIGDTTIEPALSMITGIIRVIRSKRHVDEPNFVTLEFPGPLPEPKAMAQQTITLINRVFLRTSGTAVVNGEYLLRDNSFWSNRLFRAPNASRLLDHPNRALKLTSSAPGLLNKLHFIDDPLREKPLQETEVEVEIKAVGLNFRDVMIAMGQLPSQRSGVEGAGVVTRVGSKVKNVTVGDRAMAAATEDEIGTFQTFSRFSDVTVRRIPEGMSFENAATIPVVFLTALYSLCDVARLSAGESVLIHRAAGGTGQAAIQVAKLVGATIYATVSTNEKKDLIVKEYGIEPDHIFSSRDLTFAKGIMRMTNRQGVDVVLNSLSGEALRRTWACIAPFGRFVELGLRDGLSNGRLEMSPFARNVTYSGVDLSVILQRHPAKAATLMSRVVQLFEEGKLHVLQSGKGMGKIVFKPSTEDLVPVIPESLPPYKFPEQHSYVLAGGLGGIGQSTARWMASRGAKHFIFFSRSKATTTAAKQLIEELQQQSCQVMVCVCDVSVESQLVDAIEICKISMPLIKGCIQCAMVLQDAMFENMTLERLQAAVRPKVQESWNLHKHLPTDMEFFIMLSSITGITGNRGQSNYAAGNVYQDALAKHRSSRGLPATSLNLGPVASVGYVAEKELLKKSQLMTGPAAAAYQLVTEEELHSVLEYHIDPRVPKRTKSFQTVIGLMDSATMTQKGIQKPPFLNFPLYTHLNEQQQGGSILTDGETSTEGDTASFPIRQLLPLAENIHHAAEIISQGLQHKLSSMLSIPCAEIDLSRPLYSYGVDSLVAMEIRDWMAKETAAQISTVDIIGTRSIAELGVKVAGLSRLVKSPEMGTR